MRYVCSYLFHVARVFLTPIQWYRSSRKRGFWFQIHVVIYPLLKFHMRGVGVGWEVNCSFTCWIRVLDLFHIQLLVQLLCLKLQLRKRIHLCHALACMTQCKERLCMYPLSMILGQSYFLCSTYQCEIPSQLSLDLCSCYYGHYIFLYFVHS